jgi:hypothetical protein
MRCKALQGFCTSFFYEPVLLICGLFAVAPSLAEFLDGFTSFGSGEFGSGESQKKS